MIHQMHITILNIYKLNTKDPNCIKTNTESHKRQHRSQYSNSGDFNILCHSHIGLPN